jgi:addiction module HigA family antidote
MSDGLEVTDVFPPVHPGSILLEEFIEPLQLSAGKVARACGVPRTRIERLTTGVVGVTGDTAVRLSRFFGTTPEFWMNLQSHYDLEMAKQVLGSRIDAIRRFEPAA